MSDTGPSQPPPRIYVASLADYNAGYLHGVWIDATDEIEDIWAAITQMLVASHSPNSEEWVIHDYEGFYGLRLGEYESIERVAAVARGISDHGEAFAVWVDHCEPSVDELDGFTDAYLGQWATVAAYARSLLEDYGEEIDEVGPDHLRPYFSFDLDAYARDLATEANIVEGHGGVYVFACS
jgi:antirestriction protein